MTTAAEITPHRIPTTPADFDALIGARFAELGVTEIDPAVARRVALILNPDRRRFNPRRGSN